MDALLLEKEAILHGKYDTRDGRERGLLSITEKPSPSEPCMNLFFLQHDVVTEQKALCHSLKDVYYL